MFPANLQTVTTSAQWIQYFLDNADNLLDIPWRNGLGASPEELAEILPSLRAWQLGETSDGAHLKAAARNYANEVGDADFVQAIDLFIAEEQRHGETLGRYLDMAGVPRAESDWGDRLFRTARHLFSSMEVWATPVVMVEMHAMIYYHAIRQATKCPLLRRICAQILRDEVPHIRFQCERLAILLRDRPRWLYAFTMLFHRVFFTGITLLIWMGHRRALKAGGYDFGRFWKSVWGKMESAWRRIDPHAYEWEVEPDAQAREATDSLACASGSEICS